VARINSNQKGKRGERELANKLKEYGYENARRSQQYSGLGDSSADVIGVDGLHIECKRTEIGHGKNYEWLDQAKNDAKDDNIPVVIHRANRKEWLVTLSLEDFLDVWTNKT
jgi:hypothetical protein